MQINMEKHLKQISQSFRRQTDHFLVATEIEKSYK